MEKQILKRGYVTYALTDGENEIYGIIKDHYISDWSKMSPLYWSEVYVEGSFYKIIRRGTLLANATNEELKQYFEQSKINLND
jgi:hypothetical protein